MVPSRPFTTYSHVYGAALIDESRAGAIMCLYMSRLGWKSYLTTAGPLLAQIILRTNSD